jgi:hypothetical protein
VQARPLDDNRNSVAFELKRNAAFEGYVQQIRNFNCLENASGQSPWPFASLILPSPTPLLHDGNSQEATST